MLTSIRNLSTFSNFVRYANSGVKAALPDLEKRLKPLVGPILQRQNHPEIQWVSSKSNKVFKIQDQPGIVIKTNFDDKKIDNYIRNNGMAHKICKENHFTHLVVPDAKKIVIANGPFTHSFVVEEQLPVNPLRNWQIEEFFTTDPDSLTTAITQLARLSIKMELNGLTTSHFPILSKSLSDEARRIAVFGMSSGNEILGGGLYLPGFYECYITRSIIKFLGNSKHIDLVKSELAKVVPNINEESSPHVFHSMNRILLVDEQMKKIQDYKALYENYKEQNITGKEPLNVDFSSLKLPLNSSDYYCRPKFSQRVYKTERIEISMEKIAKMIVDDINKAIEKSSDQDPIRFQRQVKITIDEHLLWLGIPALFKNRGSDDLYSWKSWVDNILESLKEKKYIFDFKKTDIDAYVIQA